MLSFDRRYLIAAIICGLAAAATLYFYLQRMERKVTATSRYTEIVVAARPLPIRTLLKQEDLRLMRIPRSTKEEGDLSSFQEAVGKVVSVALLQGQRLKKEHLLSGNNVSGLAHEIPSGWRAVTITADEVNSLSGMLMPGDRVDLLSFQKEEQKGQVLASDRQVLAVGQQTGLEKTDQGNNHHSITLLVKREEAKQIALAEELGRIRIALRPLAEEREAPPKAPVTIKKSFPQPRPKPQQTVPVVMPELEPRPTAEPILVIRGSKLQEIWPEQRWKNE